MHPYGSRECGRRHFWEGETIEIRAQGLFRRPWALLPASRSALQALPERLGRSSSGAERGTDIGTLRISIC